MRVTRNTLILSVLLVSLALMGSAFASSVTMTYKGHQGVVAKDGSPYVGYPYYVSFNGSSTFTPLMCDSFDNDVHLGQPWTASAVAFLQGIKNSMFRSVMTLDYTAAGPHFRRM